MIRIPILILAFIALTATSSAQSKTEDNKNPPAASERVKPEVRPVGDAVFLDADSDGIDDRVEASPGDNSNQDTRKARKQRRNRARDVFIAEAGDGIHDQRSEGLGLGKCGKRQFRGGRK